MKALLKEARDTHCWSHCSGLVPIPLRRSVLWSALTCWCFPLRTLVRSRTGMLSSLKTLLLLSVVCTPSSSLCLRLYQSDLLCDGVQSDRDEPDSAQLNDWSSLMQFGELLSSSSAESSREKRTSNPTNYRFISRTKLKGQMLRNSSKGDRRSRLTLSLDVPTNIMNVLFDVAKAKNLRAKAAENARLLAHVGRRK